MTAIQVTTQLCVLVSLAALLASSCFGFHCVYFGKPNGVSALLTNFHAIKHGSLAVFAWKGVLLLSLFALFGICASGSYVMLSIVQEGPDLSGLMVPTTIISFFSLFAFTEAAISQSHKNWERNTLESFQQKISTLKELRQEFRDSDRIETLSQEFDDAQAYAESLGSNLGLPGDVLMADYIIRLKQFGELLDSIRSVDEF